MEFFNEILKNKEDYLIWIRDDMIVIENRIEKTSYYYDNNKEIIYYLLCFLGMDAINMCDYYLKNI